MSNKPVVGREMSEVSILKMKELRSLQITPPEDGEDVYTVIINGVEFDYFKETGVLSRISRDDVLEDKQLTENAEKEKNELNPMEAERDQLLNQLASLQANNKAGKKKKEILETEKLIADKKIEIMLKKKEIQDNIFECWKRNTYKVIIIEANNDIIHEVKHTIAEHNL